MTRPISSSNDPNGYNARNGYITQANGEKYPSYFAEGGRGYNPSGGGKSSVIQTTTANRANTQKNIQGFNNLTSQVAQNGLANTGKTDGANDPNGAKISTDSQNKSQVTNQKQTFPRLAVPTGWLSEDTETGGQILSSPTGGKVYSNPNDNPDFIKAQATPPANSQQNSQSPTDSSASSTDTSGQEDPMDSIDSEIESIHTAAAQQVKDIQSTLKDTLKYIDTTAASTVSTLTNMYNERITSVKDSYARLSAKKNQQNIRNGLDRYAPDQAQGVLTDVEVVGQMKIADLTTKMNDAITKATDAQSANDTKAFNNAYKEIQTIQKNMTTEINTLYKTAVSYKNAQTKALHEEQMNASRKITDDVKKSTAIAPYLAEELAGMNKAEQDTFFKTYADQNGISESVLRGAVSKASLSRTNTISTIANRGKSKSAKAGGESTDGKITYTADDIGDIEAKMPRGDDNYVDTGVYTKLFNNWLKLGGTSVGFIKEFPPKTHLNPSDTSVPTIFKQYLKKPATDSDANLF
jgi:hypothetical protein